MTKEEQNQIIKDAWVRNLQKHKDIPDDVAGMYRSWVLGKVKQASEQLVQQQPQPQEEQGQGAPADGAA